LYRVHEFSLRLALLDSFSEVLPIKPAWSTMPFGSLFLTSTTIITVVLYLVGWIIYCLYLHPLRSIPGPFLASISRAWIVFKTWTGDMEHTQRALHNKHGNTWHSTITTS